MTDTLRDLIRALYLNGIESEPDYWGNTGGDAESRRAWEDRVITAWEPKFVAIEAEAAARQVTRAQLVPLLQECGRNPWTATQMADYIIRALLSAGDKAETPPAEDEDETATS